MPCDRVGLACRAREPVLVVVVPVVVVWPRRRDGEDEGKVALSMPCYDVAFAICSSDGHGRARMGGCGWMDRSRRGHGARRAGPGVVVLLWTVGHVRGRRVGAVVGSRSRRVGERWLAGEPRRQLTCCARSMNDGCWCLPARWLEIACIIALTSQSNRVGSTGIIDDHLALIRWVRSHDTKKHDPDTTRPS